MEIVETFSDAGIDGWGRIFTFDIRLLKIRIRKQSRIPPRVDLGSCLLGCLILLADAIAPKTAVRNKSMNSSNSSSRSKCSSGSRLSNEHSTGRDVMFDPGTL